MLLCSRQQFRELTINLFEDTYITRSGSSDKVWLCY